MSNVERIDSLRPMTIIGSVTRDISKMTSDPIHQPAMDLAQEMLDPAFLRMADPIEEATLRTAASPFMLWLAVTPIWSRHFYEHLQCMSQTASGEELLTTWLSVDRFWSMLEDAKGNPTFDSIRQQTAGWRQLGLDEVFFDFHVKGSSAAALQSQSQDEPVTA